MIRKIITILFLIFIPIDLLSDENKFGKDWFAIEIGGKAEIYSLNYIRYFRENLSMGVGASYRALNGIATLILPTYLRYYLKSESQSKYKFFSSIGVIPWLTYSDIEYKNGSNTIYRSATTISFGYTYYTKGNLAVILEPIVLFHNGESVKPFFLLGLSFGFPI